MNIKGGCLEKGNRRQGRIQSQGTITLAEDGRIDVQCRMSLMGKKCARAPVNVSRHSKCSNNFGKIGNGDLVRWREHVYVFVCINKMACYIPSYSNTLSYLEDDTLILNSLFSLWRLGRKNPVTIPSVYFLILKFFTACLPGLQHPPAAEVFY